MVLLRAKENLFTHIHGPSRGLLFHGPNSSAERTKPWNCQPQQGVLQTHLSDASGRRLLECLNSRVKPSCLGVKGGYKEILPAYPSSSIVKMTVWLYLEVGNSCEGPRRLWLQDLEQLDLKTCTSLGRKDSASSGSDLAYMRGAPGSFWMQRQKLGTYNDL